ncbi:MAG TPA: GTPase Era, partial [bacterium]|nr:GTPase Era [bacterium]
ELILGKKIYLELWVKVIEDWRNKIDVFRKFGYGNF